MLAYCSGISQPPNSMRRAPAARCQSNSGVRRAIPPENAGADESLPPAKLMATPIITHGRHGAVGQYKIWEAFFGFLALLAGGFYFVDTIRKEREFDRLISTTSKELFVKNMKRIEQLTYEHLPSAYERRFLEKKQEFRIKG
ncbi:MAG: DUF3198 domain-containing protein [Methanobacteriota archaeon]|nr:MAG: DUF3198 domain-containing protein [Euryarchaeota archaeon]